LGGTLGYGGFARSWFASDNILFLRYLDGSILLILAGSPGVVLACRHYRILHGIPIADACGHRLQNFGLVESKEERCRISLLSTLIDDPVDGRDEKVVSLPHEAVCDVHYHRPWYRVRLDPAALFTEHLETSAVILGNECETLDIGVCAYATMRQSFVL